jgi:hypothetical protein
MENYTCGVQILIAGWLKNWNIIRDLVAPKTSVIHNIVRRLQIKE